MGGFDQLYEAVDQHDRIVDVRNTKPFKFERVDDLRDEQLPPWLIKDIMIDKTMGLLFGPPGVGKSFLALDWAMHIAANKTWMGQYTVQSGPFVYIAAEGGGGFGTRVKTWVDTYGKPENDHLFLRRHIDLLSTEEAHRFAVAIGEELKATPTIVVVDTMARMMVGGDENSVKDVGRFVENCALIQQKLNTSVLIVHHPDKQGKAERGSTALRGAMDMMAYLDDATGGGMVLRCMKQKDAIEFPKIYMRLDPRGDSCIVSPPLLHRFTHEEEDHE